METPLHKLVKLRNKKFFLEICKKLKEINVLNEELLSNKNINGLMCYNEIAKEIEFKKNIIIKNDKDFELYNNFINDYPNLYEALPSETKKSVKLFSLKITIDTKILKEIDCNTTLNEVENLIRNNTDNIKYLYYPTTSGINYLNYLFNICKSNEDYDRLFKLILNLNNNNQFLEFN